MTNKHLNDIEIQQYILEKTNCDTDIVEHMQHCTNCEAKAAEYNLIFDEIQQQAKPIFNFNLADLVVAQLPKPQPKVAKEKWVFYFIIFIAVFSVCAIFYLFGNNLQNLLFGTKPILTGLIITTVAILLVFLCIDMYRKYQAQINALNFI